MSGWPARVAVGSAAVAVVTAVGDIALRLGAGAGAELLSENTTSGDLTAVSYGLVGAYLARARPRNPVGWVLLVVALLLGLSGLASGYATVNDPSAARTFAAWVASWLWFPGFALLPTVLVALYPSGSAGRWRRRLVAGSLVGAWSVGLGFALNPEMIRDVAPDLDNPVTVPGLWVVLAVGGALVLLTCIVLTLADAGRRLWRGRSPEREQLAWLLTAVVVVVGLNYLPLGQAGLLTSVLLPVAIAVGVVRHRLLDLQVVVRRTLLFAALTGVVVAVFVVTTTALSPLLESGPLPVAVAAALVAVGLTPVREVLQRGVDRLVYGHRHDPLRAVASLGRDVAEQDDARLVPQVLRTVAAAVRSPHVVLLDSDGEPTASAGSPADGDPLRLPLQVGGRTVGGLLVSPRTARDAWSSQDRELLGLLAHQVAVVVHTARLNAELAGSRDHVLAATAAERQRLHQELHDGLGPALSGIALGLEAAEASLARAPGRTTELLARLRAETQTAGREVRRLVQGLRPAALDRQGLGTALTAFVDNLRHVGRLDVGLVLPEALPPLAPDADAAAYRIVTEAVTNVVRHSGASTCQVIVTVDPAGLRLVVEDDGNGLPVQPRNGVGLASMRRRAAEFGGTWSAGPREGGGTRIEVVLPVAAVAQVPDAGAPL